MTPPRLAYVFWHRRSADVEASAYERRLAAFHRSLADAPPAGFAGSATFAVRGLPWMAAGTEAYEDWYGVDGWDALAALNTGAVDGARRSPHDLIAAAVADGAGGLYQLRGGAGEVRHVRFAAWVAKPAGLTYAGFDELLEDVVARPGHALWQRQMVLGPAPEFCVVAPATLVLDTSLEPLVIARRPVWPAGPAAS